jgi:hypothetical protein
MSKIKQISVTNLFGIFNHTIPLFIDDRVTIIHSPNGFGKTAILRLLSDLFSQRTRALMTTPFNELRIEFEDGSHFWVTRSFDNASEMGTRTKLKKDLLPKIPKITFYFRDRDNGEKNFLLKSPQMRAIRDTLPLGAIDSIIPELDRIGVQTWKNTRTGEIVSFEEILERYSDQLVSFPGFSSAYEKEPDWLREIRGSIPIRFIETQRLLNPKKVSKQKRKVAHVVKTEKLAKLRATFLLFRCYSFCLCPAAPL